VHEQGWLHPAYGFASVIAVTGFKTRFFTLKMSKTSLAELIALPQAP